MFWQDALSKNVVDTFQLYVHVCLKKATNLPAMDLSGASDPYCVVNLGEQTYSSKILPRTLNPVWDESCSLELTEADEKTDLIIDVFDHDRIGTDDYIGGVRVGLIDIANANNNISKTYELVKVKVSASKSLRVRGRNILKSLSRDSSPAPSPVGSPRAGGQLGAVSPRSPRSPICGGGQLSVHGTYPGYSGMSPLGSPYASPVGSPKAASFYGTIPDYNPRGRSKRSRGEITVEITITANEEGVLSQCFGIEIDCLESEAQDGYDVPIPKVLTILKKHLMSSGGMGCEGIFRTAPDTSRCALSKMLLNCGMHEHALLGVDPAIVANLIKIWYRDMKTPILNHEGKEARFGAVKNQVACQNILNDMEEPNKSLFLFIVDVALEISSNSSENKMGPNNLAIVICPNLYSQVIEPMHAIRIGQSIVDFFVATMELRSKHIKSS